MNQSIKARLPRHRWRERRRRRPRRLHELPAELGPGRGQHQRRRREQVRCHDQLCGRHPVQGRQAADVPDHDPQQPELPVQGELALLRPSEAADQRQLQPHRGAVRGLQHQGRHADRGGPAALHHPQDLPGRGGPRTWRAARSCRSATTSSTDAELPGQGRRVEPGRRPQHPASVRRQVLPAARPAPERGVRLHHGRPYRPAVQVQHRHPVDAGAGRGDADDVQGQEPGSLPVLRPLQPADRRRRVPGDDRQRVRHERGLELPELQPGRVLRPRAPRSTCSPPRCRSTSRWSRCSTAGTTRA